IDPRGDREQADRPPTGLPQDKMQRKEAWDPDTKDETIAPVRDGEARPAAGDARPVTAEVPPSAAIGGNPPPVTRTADFDLGEGIRPYQQDGGSRAHQSLVEAIGGEEIFVGQAGVVLLHPFLHSIFRILGYVEGGQFRTPELHTRALHLIHYLATGETTAHEHDLLIAKLLCAWPLDVPVDGETALTETELAEAGDLLTAAITQWDKVKHTSHTGLREGFLQRSGKLQAKGNDLYLQVETSSIDVLLDYLPWNLSIVKLPWMNNILRVEWR
ncbi:MAG TPA: contractile injection system tape measure protein, partial [Puia sp.]